ncbi:decaprenyl-phosphate phosphoribosyltransferase [Anaeromyxobacter paludicola]|uniref:Decaprenyl-phosphate phosphoribosyltransferase n=1 Tax=Anaeromyxobacter paludicola TaxID=2918171 RepID=A0ABM7XCS0_9BACT|nr:decaprenyl-phosphate phosphoribosyltransferase [Anaeromyxobacter paludicola]BDG09660.1 decaprenyl-phosphate phosphoribosyltransferase [Anaeromyxobacter paludicola]
MTRPAALLAALRPRQWTKNLALLAPLLFAQRAGDPAAASRALLGFLAFCLAASAVYLGNDLADREADRLHPEKRLRPLASGAISARAAAVTGVALALLALALGFFLPARFLACVAGYFALQLAYNAGLKRLVIVDVFAIAAGFVLRVVAGAEAIDVPISNWLYLCTLLLALFLALAKRRAELSLLSADAARHRAILAEYSVPLVDQLVGVTSASAILAYALYTTAADTVQKFGTDRLKFTVPLVIFGLFRYLYLVARRGEGGHPERVLLHDRPTQVNLVLYVATVAWALYSR